MTKQEQLAEFLARKGPTVCPPADSFAAQAVPLGRARRTHERGLTEPDMGDEEIREREVACERRYLELQGIRP